MLVAALFAMAQAQAPAPPASAFDLRCLVVLSELRSSTDEAVRASATAGALFYFARADARLSPAELEEGLMEHAIGLSEADRGPLVRDCGAFMQERGRFLTAIAQRMMRAADEAGGADNNSP